MKFNFFGDSSDECREERIQAKRERRLSSVCPSCGLLMRSHAMNCPNYEEDETGEENEE
jgi:hypothetical protein